MFLVKRRNGFYHVYYHTKDGKKRTITTKKKTKSDALKFLTNFEQYLAKKESDELPEISLNKFSFQFQRNAELTKAEKTCKVYKTTFNYFKEYFGDVNISTITQADIKKYLEYRFTKHSVFAARKDLINLKAAFRYAIEENYLSTNPCKGIKQYRIAERQPLYFSKDDFDTLLKVIDDQEFKNLVIIAANTGLRLMELITLSWKQVNLGTRNILLDNHQHLTKTRKVRSIPINDNIYDILAEMYKNKSSENVFSYSGKNVDVLVSQKLKSYVLKAKLNPKLHFHSLRHSFASWLVQNGVNIYLVSKLLGHSNIQTTDIYSHLRQDDLLASVNSI